MLSQLPDDDRTKISELQLANDSEESLFAGAAASNQPLADYLRSGFWIDFGSSTRKFNISNSGTYAKNGIITCNTTANNFDSDGLSSARQLLVDEAFKLFEEVLGIDFQSSSEVNADFRFGGANSGAYASTIILGGNINYVMSISTLAGIACRAVSVTVLLGPFSMKLAMDSA